jgi:hypothetical protein
VRPDERHNQLVGEGTFRPAHAQLARIREELLDDGAAPRAHRLGEGVDREDVVEVHRELERHLNEEDMPRDAAPFAPRLDRLVVGVAPARQRQVLERESPPSACEHDPTGRHPRQERRRRERSPEARAGRVPLLQPAQEAVDRGPALEVVMGAREPRNDPSAEPLRPQDQLGAVERHEQVVERDAPLRRCTGPAETLDLVGPQDRPRKHVHVARPREMHGTQRSDLVFLRDGSACGQADPVERLAFDPGLLYPTRDEAVRDGLARLRAADAIDRRRADPTRRGSRM